MFEDGIPQPQVSEAQTQHVNMLNLGQPEEIKRNESFDIGPSSGIPIYEDLIKNTGDRMSVPKNSFIQIVIEEESKEVCPQYIWIGLVSVILSSAVAGLIVWINKLSKSEHFKDDCGTDLNY